jgi:moderate conductance mechanosensitive channel
MLNSLDSSLLTVLDPSHLTGALIYAFIFLVLALLGMALVRIFSRRSAKYFSDQTGIHFVSQLLQVVVFLVAIILYAQLVPGLRSFGTALLTGVSIVSVIIGLAAQSTLGNLVAGLSLLLYRPFEAGDQVQLNTPKGMQTGTIESVTLGYTILRSGEDEQIVVPNSVMASAVIIKIGLRSQD